VFVLLKGGAAGFAVLGSLIAVLAMLEYFGLLMPEETWSAKGWGVLCALFILAGFYYGKVEMVMAVLTGAFLAMAAFFLFRNFPPPWIVERLSKQMMGLVYIPVLLGHLILLRNGPEGLLWTIMLLAMVFANDTGAYYVGHSIGRRKLCPTISPGKTVEGAVGGLAAGAVVACIVSLLALPRLSWWSCIGLALVTGAGSQIGDLTESALKRSAAVKDSGRFFPGHGGILDRIDGLLFAAPVVYYLKDYLITS
jgi:phosphatidate cytidylyltransferase